MKRAALLALSLVACGGPAFTLGTEDGLTLNTPDASNTSIDASIDSSSNSDAGIQFDADRPDVQGDVQIDVQPDVYALPPTCTPIASYEWRCGDAGLRPVAPSEECYTILAYTGARTMPSECQCVETYTCACAIAFIEENGNPCAAKGVKSCVDVHDGGPWLTCK